MLARVDMLCLDKQKLPMVQSYIHRIKNETGLTLKNIISAVLMQKMIIT